jgi:hypothetical protein
VLYAGIAADNQLLSTNDQGFILICGQGNDILEKGAPKTCVCRGIHIKRTEVTDTV